MLINVISLISRVALILKILITWIINNCKNLIVFDIVLHIQSDYFFKINNALNCLNIRACRFDNNRTEQR